MMLMKALTCILRTKLVMIFYSQILSENYKEITQVLEMECNTYYEFSYIKHFIASCDRALNYDF